MKLENLVGEKDCSFVSAEELFVLARCLEEVNDVLNWGGGFSYYTILLETLSGKHWFGQKMMEICIKLEEASRFAMFLLWHQAIHKRSGESCGIDDLKWAWKGLLDKGNPAHLPQTQSLESKMPSHYNVAYPEVILLMEPGPPSTSARNLKRGFPGQLFLIPPPMFLLSTTFWYLEQFFSTLW